MSRLVYSCVFFNEEYLALLNLLLESFSRHDSSNTKYLVITTPRFQERIQEMFDTHGVNGNMWCINSIYTQFAGCCARLQIFNYPEIDKYDTILYLDTDILITNPLEPLFDVDLEEKLYGSASAHTTVNDWGNGKELFLENKINIPLDTPQLLSTCSLLFKNCAKIKSLFADVTTHIAERVPGDYDLDGSFDQDFIIYQCYIQDCYENSHLTKFIKYCAFDADSDMILNHFCSHYSSNCGMPDGKLDQMKVYLSRIGLKQHAKNIIHVGANIGDCYHESEALSLFNNVSVNDNCIFIEPVPYLFKQLKENYNNKYSDNNFTFINKAVSDTTGKAEMTIASEDNDFTNLDKWSFAFIGSLDPQHMPKHVEKTGVELELDTITVPTITLNDLVKESGMTIVDILIIDAEGYDYRILMDYDFIIKPKKLIFEHCYMTEGSLAILLFNLQLMGYKQIGYTQLDMVFELS